MTGDEDLFARLYRENRNAFITYAQRQLGATEEDAADCFQDAVIAFHENLTSGRLTELTCSERTYLFAIGKRYVYRRNHHRKREQPTDHEAGINPADELDWSLVDRFEDDHRRTLLLRAINQLGDACRDILTLFYYKNYPIESIQDALGFSSPGAVRIKKMRCLDKLKGLL